MAQQRSAKQLITSIETTAVRAVTLLADGYQIYPHPEGTRTARPGQLGVYKPGQTPDLDRPAYVLTLWQEETVNRRTGESGLIWRYHCTCGMYQSLAWHQERANATWEQICNELGLDCPICKHGECAVMEVQKAFALTEHLRGQVLWGPTRERKAQTSTGDDNPWPTRRAIRKAVP
jgi:hypothetical protein